MPLQAAQVQEYGRPSRSMSDMSDATASKKHSSHHRSHGRKRSKSRSSGDEDDPKELRFLARVADQAGRHDDMVLLVKDLVQLKPTISKKDTTVISSAYRHVVAPRRAAWRIVIGQLDAYDTRVGEEYLAVIEKELSHYCWDAIDVADLALSKCSGSVKRELFLLKMKADYYRYLAEVDIFHLSRAADSQAQVLDLETVKEAWASYKGAMDLSEDCRQKSLKQKSSSGQQLHNSGSSTPHGCLMADVTHLGLVLNYAVFTKEILGNTEAAILMCEETFAKALSQLDLLKEDEYQQATDIMRIIQNNLSLWKDDAY